MKRNEDERIILQYDTRKWAVLGFSAPFSHLKAAWPSPYTRQIINDKWWWAIMRRTTLVSELTLRENMRPLVIILLLDAVVLRDTQSSTILQGKAVSVESAKW